MYGDQKRDLADVLEQQIDRYTLTVVLDALEEICFLKGVHIEHEWQDNNTAKPWSDAAKRIDKVRAFASDRRI